MRFIPLLVLSVLSTRAAAADAPKIFAEVEIKVAGSVDKKAAGIRTLYITLYDEASQAPMPYGAMKVALEKDATGVVYKGKLDQANVMVMGGGDMPKKLRIKAKLDKDGSAGPDSAGDIVGIATGVEAGGKTAITIDKAL